MMTIDDIRAMMEKACTHAERLELRIKPGNFGVEKLEPDGTGCCCPIGALELYLKMPKHTFEFDYDPFVEGFDTTLVGGALEKAALGWSDDIYRELFRLGHEFRKKFVKEAA
jgi:hypothetical protein